MTRVWATATRLTAVLALAVLAFVGLVNAVADGAATDAQSSEGSGLSVGAIVALCVSGAIVVASVLFIREVIRRVQRGTAP